MKRIIEEFLVFVARAMLGVMLVGIGMAVFENTQKGLYITLLGIGVILITAGISYWMDKIHDYTLYEAKYCEEILQGHWVTLSIHRTKDGAEKAIIDHKVKTCDEYHLMTKEYKSQYAWNSGKDWEVTPIDILD